MAKKETAEQKRERQRRALCGKCMKPIDLFEVRNARLLGTSYMHGCGRWLVRGGKESEVPTNHLNDADSDITSPSQSAGDA